MRRDEREFALKILFACEFSDESWETHKNLFNKNELKFETHFSKCIIANYLEHKNDIDKKLINHIQNWDYNRVAVLDRILLRISVIEFLYFPDIPPEATINEALEMAKKYSTPQSSYFVNGVLDSVLKEIKEDLRIIKKGRGRISKILK